MIIEPLTVNSDELRIKSSFDIKYSDISDSTVCVDFGLVSGVESVWYINRLIQSLECICR